MFRLKHLASDLSEDVRKCHSSHAQKHAQETCSSFLHHNDARLRTFFKNIGLLSQQPWLMIQAIIAENTAEQ